MPELSIVMAGSNDDYGSEVYREVETTPTSHFKDRCSRCIYTVHESFKHLDYELIFVIWNEDSTRESLLTWSFLQHPRIRLIVVPPEIAQTVDDWQFNEAWAKNVGIRRARSEMILSTNPDILWLDNFPRDTLDIDSVMIAMRWTLNKSVMDEGFDIEAMRRYSQDVITRRNPDWGSNGDFTMMPRSLWWELKGLCTPRQEAMAGIDQRQIKRAEQLVGKVYQYPFPIYHIEHCGKALASSYMQIIVSEEWGFGERKFKEYRDGKEIDIN